MREHTMRRIEVGAAPFLEEKETIRAGTVAFIGPRWGLFFGLLAWVMVKQYLVLVTDRNVYVMEADVWTGKKAKSVRAKHPLGSVAVTAERGLPVGPLRVGDLSLWVAKLYQTDAEQVASASQA